MHQRTYFFITTSELVESSLAQFDYIHCAGSAATPMSGFEPWPQDGKLVHNQCSNHSAKLDNWKHFQILSIYERGCIFC